jgi:cell wall-associated NlpC family hydrolase
MGARAFAPGSAACLPYLRKCLLAVFTALMLFAFLAAFAGASASAITIRGGVSCKYHPVTGVWLQSSTGGSKFASWSKASPGGYGVAFSASIAPRSLPTKIQLHVGCGRGSKAGSWWSDNWTADRSVSGSATLDATCNEGTTRSVAGRNTRCAWQSVASVIVNAAKSMKGYHYCWAGGTTTGPTHGAGNSNGATACGSTSTIGFDCTGLTLFAVFHATDIKLLHTPSQAVSAQSYGKRITIRSQLRPGDLVFLGGTWTNVKHSAIYAGNGWVWDANTAYPGYSDGVQYRSLASLEHGLPFIGAVRFS